MLYNLVAKRYLVKEHYKDIVEVVVNNSKTRKKRQQDKTKSIRYNIISGKLRFEFTRILDSKGVDNSIFKENPHHHL